MVKKEDVKYCLLLCLTTAISYFQLVLNIFPTKWDNLSAFFPYRYTAMHWWRNGHIPFWDPYQNFGYPMHANPQGAVWYPVTWLFGAVKGYTQYSMNLELVFHVLVAGIGMYFFLKTIRLKPMISFIGGMIYSLSGFISGTSHMIGFTAGAAWLPWCLMFLLLCYRTKKIKFILLLSLTLSLQLTGAYTAFSIVLVYLIGIVSAFYIFTSNNKHQTLLYTIKLGLIVVAATLVLTGPYLYSIYESLPYFSRATPLSYDPNSFSSNFNWQCFQSLIVPYVISAKQGFTGVDVSMGNIYFGFIPLMVFVYALLKLKNTKQKKLLTVGILIAMLLMLGNNTPVHEWSIKFIPGFALFRHPYLFGLYAVFGMVVITSLSLNNFQYSSIKSRFFRTVLGSLILALIVLGAKSDLFYFNEYLDYWSALREKSPLNNFSHAFIQLSFYVILFLGALIWIKNKKHIFKLIPTLIFLELVFAIQANGPLHMYYNVPSKNINDYLQNTAAIKLTNQTISKPLDVLQNSKIKPTIGLWSNLNTFKRTTGINGYNPFIFTSTENLQKSSSYPGIISKGLVTSTDSNCIKNLKLGYNEMRFEYSSNTQSVINISQNYHHNWTARLNNRPIELYTDSTGLQRMDLEAGSGEVHLVYNSIVIRGLLILQLLSTVVFLCLVFGRVRRIPSI